MKSQDFTTTIRVEQSPSDAFAAITNVRGWWSEEIKGNSSKVNDVFDYHFEDIHRCKIKVIEVVPDKRVVWHVLDNYFNFTKDDTEWKDTRVIFEIAAKNGKTEIRFTHEGLVPEYECYDACHEGWTQYITKSLFNLITNGKGNPNATGKAQTKREEQLRQKA
ncbi:MAG TPA: SRPBCC domain-containing protein [Chryseosolibacter sp.]